MTSDNFSCISRYVHTSQKPQGVFISAIKGGWISESSLAADRVNSPVVLFD
jgi:hypothetical protein